MPYAGLPYALPFWLPDAALVPPETGAGISPQTDTAQLAVNRLRQYLKTTGSTAKPNVGMVLQACCNQTDALDAAFQALYFYRMLANAYGVLLDNIGEIVGLSRSNLDDPTYRAYLQAQIIADNSSGTTEDLNAIFALVVPTVGTGVTFVVTWEFPAAFFVVLTDPNGVLTSAEVTAFAHFVNSARAAGVDGFLIYSYGTPLADLFTFDNPVAWTASTVKAIGDEVWVATSVWVCTAVTGDAKTAASGPGPVGIGTFVDNHVTWTFCAHGKIGHGLGLDQGYWAGAAV